MTRRAAALAAVLLAGCGTTEPVAESGDGAGLTPTVFIEVMAELTQAAEAAPTTEAYEAQKQAILERHGTSADALVGFAERYGADAETMAAVWDSIKQSLMPAITKSPPPAGAAPDSPAPAAGQRPHGGNE